MVRIALVDAIYMAGGYKNAIEAIDPEWEKL
jgi:hypothetical protein